MRKGDNLLSTPIDFDFPYCEVDKKSGKETMYIITATCREFDGKNMHLIIWKVIAAKSKDKAISREYFTVKENVEKELDLNADFKRAVMICLRDEMNKRNE